MVTNAIKQTLITRTRTCEYARENTFKYAMGGGEMKINLIKKTYWCYFEALGLFSVEPQHRHPVSIVGGTKRTTNATCSASNCIYDDTER
jgi:hypothetical protein